MKILEVIDEARKKKRKKRLKRAAYGPGPFGMYGTNAGYSGGGDGGVGEAAYPGNLGAMEMAEFFKKATPQQKALLKKFIEEKNSKSAWALIQKITGTKLIGPQFQEGQFRSNDIEEFKPSNDSLNDLKSKYLPDWEMLDHRTLQAKYVAKDHRHAEEFVSWINKLSEKMDHFAEVTQDVAEVTVKTTTFDVKGLTILDFQLALYIDHYAEKQDIEQVRMSGNFGMHEGISTNLSIKSIIATADSITKTYGDLKTMAEKWVYNNGQLNGFHRNAAGVGKRWYDTFYWNKMEDDLRTLLKKDPKRAAALADFFNIKRDDRGHVSFTTISKSLPKILYQVGEKIGSDELKKFGRNWALKQKDYEDFLGRVEAEVNDDDDFVPAPKQPKDNVVGRQNAAAEDMVNQVLRSIDKKVAGEIRNAIAREPNKLQALQRELAKRKIKVGESLSEGWKDTVAGLALGAGVALGNPASANVEYVMVSPGQTVYSIAKAFDTTPQTIQKLNKLDKNFTIKPGQELKVPKWDEITEPKKKKTAAKTPTKTKTLTGNPYEALLTNAARAGGITDPVELAAFLAQSLVETGQFKDLDEKGSKRRIERLYDPKYNPEGAKEIGNTKIGDGWRYRGRGFLQLTGRYNYTAASKALGLNLVKNPDLALKPEIAAKTAVWYWKWRVRPNVSNFNNTTRITELVQGGSHQLERRKMIFADFKKFNLEQT